MHGRSNYVKESGNISTHLVSFNFPDYDLHSRNKVTEKTTFGTIQEILPVLYMLKKIVVDGKIDTVDLYGFSAGGGAVVNALAILNSDRYQKEVGAIGITTADRKKILHALQRGHIILNCPLKTLSEIMALRGRTHEFAVFERRYKANGFTPVDALRGLDGLALKVLLHFQKPDEILSNRDDNIFVQNLRRYNAKGKTTVVIGSDGGHVSFHKSLWKRYPSFIAEKR